MVLAIPSYRGCGLRRSVRVMHRLVRTQSVCASRKALPIIAWGNLHRSQEGAAHLVFGAEAALVCDGLQAIIRFLELPTRGVHAKCLDRLCRRPASFCGISAREVA